MAINIKNFVDISSTFPTANVAGRSFGGLVFTTATMEPVPGKAGVGGIQVGTDGRPVPKDPNGEAYPSDGTNYYFIDGGGNRHNWVWSETDKQYSYSATIEGELQVFYPANADAISAYESYSAGEVIRCTLNEVLAYFGIASDEYKFASGYYGYSSPTGRFASRLSFAKVRTDETPLAAFSRVNEETNLFGSFTFLSVNDVGSSAVGDGLDSLRDVAAYNASLDTKYLFVVNDVRGGQSRTAVGAKILNGFKDVKGTCFVSGATDVSAYMPMAILAATDYATGQVVNYMFKQFGTEQSTVKDDATYEYFNSKYINFYGRTQTNGQTLDFYQRGFNSNGVDTAVYCNEMWFKAACETRLMGVLLNGERLPANDSGRDSVVIAVDAICQQATGNGMMMQKTISMTQRKDIANLLASLGSNETAGTEVDRVNTIVTDLAINGYSIYAYISFVQNTEKLSAGGEYVIHYYVFYGTADSIRYIKGDDILLQ